MRHRITPAVLAVVVAIMTAVGAAGTANAASAPTPSAAGGPAIQALYYQVVDADNDPYSGIYLRDSTAMWNANRVPYRYMLYGTTVELLCGAWGEAVGPYHNQRWHWVYVPSGHAAGQLGWVADRYLNTPNRAHEYTPGEPECW